jgi:protein-L-isoaspartate O-methyltransferase
VELHDDVIEHCKASFAKWKVTSINENGNISTISFMDDDTPDIHIIKGNGLNILNSEGESVVGYDRIYIGAAVERTDLTSITKLLSPGGILVGPGKLLTVWLVRLLVCICALLICCPLFS